MSASGWLWLTAGYGSWVAFASLVAAALVAWDKRQARRDRWRVPEATLHLWEILGGWPGSLWARRRLRHKTAKRSYIWKARLMVGLHGLAVLMAVTWLSRI
ncbi:MAG: DUF1294 domain-containing protein [Planctomycetota bacterium]